MIALLLAVLTLSACGSKKQAVEEKQTTETTQPQPTHPEVAQQEMSAEQLQLALREVDLSALCAGMAAVQRQGQMANQYYSYLSQVCYNDYNQDGTPDILIGGYDAFNFTFSLSPDRTVFYAISENSEGFNHYYTDSNGRLYRWSGYYDFNDYVENGQELFRNTVAEWYEQYENGQWKVVYSYGGYRITTPGNEENGYQSILVENQVDGYIQDKKVTEAELDEHLASIGMTRVESQADEFTGHTYDVGYRDCLLNELDQYFASQYPGYIGARNVDVDNDGQEETVFFLPEIDDVWYQSLQSTSQIDTYRLVFDDNLSLNAVVIADEQDGKLIIQSYAAPTNIYYHSDMTVSWNGCFLMLGDSSIYGGNMDAQTNAPEALAQYLASFGFENSMIRKVDITDMPEDEYLCVSCKDGIWSIVLIVLKNGNPALVYSKSLEKSAIYLTEYDGKQCLLVYDQVVFEMSNGLHTNNFLYNLLRFDEKGNEIYLENNSVAYNDSTIDATKVAEFFEKLNGYLLKIIVVYDPYMLTGKQWMDQNDAQYGTAPETPQEIPEDATMGFVQIEDPSSWLNLREGPGVNYAKVLTDPTNPESFVRQALGSPVTILETVETGDAENPVWVKVRISYGDREYVGYCSKSYIRLAGE